jgi:hypothetical protein
VGVELTEEGAGGGDVRRGGDLHGGFSGHGYVRMCGLVEGGNCEDHGVWGDGVDDSGRCIVTPLYSPTSLPFVHQHHLSDDS